MVRDASEFEAPAGLDAVPAPALAAEALTSLPGCGTAAGIGGGLAPSTTLWPTEKSPWPRRTATTTLSFTLPRNFFSTPSVGPTRTAISFFFTSSGAHENI